MWRFLKYLCIILSLFLGQFNLYAQRLNTNQLDSQKLKDDISLLYNVLNEAHPSTYRFVSKDSVRSWIQDLNTQAEMPLSLLNFKLLIQKFIVKLSSGHTSTTPSAASLDPKLHYYFPFLVTVQNDKLFIYKNLVEKDSFAVGSEILFVNGTPASRLLNEIRSLISSDGNSNHYKDFKIEKTFAFFNLIKEVYGHQQVFKIVLRDEFQKVKEYNFPSVFHKVAKISIFDYLPPANTDSNKLRALSFPKEIPSTALLKISSFNFKDDEANKKFYQQTFEAISKRKSKNLILDLRGNTGGSFFAALDLLTYLLPKPFQLVSSFYTPVRVSSFNAHFYKQSEYTNPTKFIFKSDSGYSVKSRATALTEPVKNLVFKGEIFIWIDGGTFSSAAMFASFLKNKRSVIVIGSESGGGQNGLDCSPFEVLELPYSRIKINVPRFYATINVKCNSCPGGIKPDTFYRTSPRELFEKADKTLLITKQIVLKR